MFLIFFPLFFLYFPFLLLQVLLIPSFFLQFLLLESFLLLFFSLLCFLHLNLQLSPHFFFLFMLDLLLIHCHILELQQVPSSSLMDFHQFFILLCFLSILFVFVVNLFDWFLVDIIAMRITVYLVRRLLLLWGIRLIGLGMLWLLWSAAVVILIWVILIAIWLKRSISWNSLLRLHYTGLIASCGVIWRQMCKLFFLAIAVILFSGLLSVVVKLFWMVVLGWWIRRSFHSGTIRSIL